MRSSRPTNLPRDHAIRNLPGRTVVHDHLDDTVGQLANELMHTARVTGGATGAFHLALSGGSTPHALFEHLLIDPRCRVFPWPTVHIWLVDERCVDEDDERSNLGAIRRRLLSHVPVPADQIHAMPVFQPDGPMAYEIDLRHWLDDRQGRLDAVLLGMGGDGHTASLFPGSPALTETQRWVVVNDGPTVAPPRPRMTMTYPLLNAARWVGVLVAGESKHAMIQRVALAAEPDIDRLPITGINPAKAPGNRDAQLTWYLDRAAALGAQADA